MTADPGGKPDQQGAAVNRNDLGTTYVITGEDRDTIAAVVEQWA